MSARYVWVVSWYWDYEGGEVQAVYESKRDADKHPNGGDEIRIEKMRVIKKRKLVKK
jgi:hypothetical protein